MYNNSEESLLVHTTIYFVIPDALADVTKLGIKPSGGGLVTYHCTILGPRVLLNLNFSHSTLYHL